MADIHARPPSAESRGEAPGRGRLLGRKILVVGGGQRTFDAATDPIGNGRAMSILSAWKSPCCHPYFSTWELRFRLKSASFTPYSSSMFVTATRGGSVPHPSKSTRLEAKYSSIVL